MPLHEWNMSNANISHSNCHQVTVHMVWTSASIRTYSHMWCLHIRFLLHAFFARISGRMFTLQSFRMFAQHMALCSGLPLTDHTSDLQQNPPVPHDRLARLMIKINRPAFHTQALKQSLIVAHVIFGWCLLPWFPGFHSLSWVVWYWKNVCDTEMCHLLRVALI